MAGTRKLGKPTDQRLAMLRCQTTDLLLNGKIVTTEAAASDKLFNASATTATDFEKIPARSFNRKSKTLKQIPTIPHKTPYLPRTSGFFTSSRFFIKIRQRRFIISYKP